MAGAIISCSVYEFDSVVRGHHIYKTVWTAMIDETLQVALEDTNEHDEYAIAITRGGCIVGHIPWEISRICLFLDTWHHQLQNRRPQKESSCVYTFTSSLDNIVKLCSLLDKHGNSYQQ